ncbi:MAG: alpha-glucan family phosphorylase [Kiritimatiellae bacterium]|jgi:starch phosphorylase|nr:alpha-glucan family phosphorylase [Kiritimatiellia bacterium]
MNRIQEFDVLPQIPEELFFLCELSENLWWSWNSSAFEFFERLNPRLWKKLGYNPILLRFSVSQKDIDALANDPSSVSGLTMLKNQYEAYMSETKIDDKTCVGYFSLEYGIHETLRLYSGGLGVLAGDHLKSSSDLGIPLVAVGLLYRKGYFRQKLDNSGWQQEEYPVNDYASLPLKKVYDKDDKQVRVSVPIPGNVIHADLWRFDIGCIKLYLLDTNIAANTPDIKEITGSLYGGDKPMRLRQELLLGIGGYNALIAAGHDPIACHMNEGHAAFLSVARFARFTKSLGLSADKAIALIRRTNIFTTHTPVPAGNETFKIDLLRPYLDVLLKDLDTTVDRFLSFGQEGDHIGDEISMTILGLKSSIYSNGVSALHGKVAKDMWASIWPNYNSDEVPIDSITNGVHPSTWVGGRLKSIYERYLGPLWEQDFDDSTMLNRIYQIPDDELWQAKERARTKLVRFVRERVGAQFKNRNAERSQLKKVESILDHDTLTIGFARRFATYKRATLLLQDRERFKALLISEKYPIQFVFAGKAHPADDEGKMFIQEIFKFAEDEGVRHRIVFIEDYDISVARRLVQGVDVWLNVPRYPQEASGTSGMKAAMNGALNLSVPDGWWAEGYSANRGWAVGNGEIYKDAQYQDSIESQALFNILENKVIPMFYDRHTHDIPVAWIRMMKSSIKMAIGTFSSHRMVNDYYTKFYMPAMANYKKLFDEPANLDEVVALTGRIKSHWHKLWLGFPKINHDLSRVAIGTEFVISCDVFLDGLNHADVDVEFCCGKTNDTKNVDEYFVEKMKMVEDKGQGSYLYEAKFSCKETGHFGFAARITPSDAELKALTPGFVIWAE